MRFFFKRVENRQSITLTRALENVIRVGTILYYDGHPSYPGVCENLELEHRIVNHSTGFVNEYCESTNRIEAFWSHLKFAMRKENGVKRVDIDAWIDEYTFKRRFVVGTKAEEFNDVFIKLLKFFFEMNKFFFNFFYMVPTCI